MWKALIKWVESWSYRCDHKWEKIDELNIYESPWDKMPYQRKHVYMCKNCGESKTIKT